MSDADVVDVKAKEKEKALADVAAAVAPKKTPPRYVPRTPYDPYGLKT